MIARYGWSVVMDFRDANPIDYVLGLPTNAVLRADPVIVRAADACATARAQQQYPTLRHYAEAPYAAKTWQGSGASLPESRPAPCA